MRRLRFLLRPSWIMLALVVAAFAYLCFNVLAPWQLGKNHTTQERNDLIQASMDADPVPVTSVLGSNAPKKSDEWRRVSASGVYDKSNVLVRLQSYQGFPAFMVLTPFHLDDGSSVLINRGYVKASEANQPPTLAPVPAGHVTIEGRLRLRQIAAEDKKPVFESGYWQIYAVDPIAVGGILKNNLPSGYLQLSDGQPGAFAAVELPQLDSGPYLSYGLQWLAFGVMAPLGLAYFIRAELRERRKEQPAVSTSATPTPPTPADKLTDRYGKRR
ncbi:MAG: hypothetical protein LLG14_14635 [Nocardiaceae bacterium]|nr:hypothetical protein [Nocardiaceae bacterium]